MTAIKSEPIAWIFEDDLPESYPYDTMFEFSKVDGVRLFPVYAPSPAFTDAAQSAAEKVARALWPFADVADLMDCETSGFSQEDTLSLDFKGEFDEVTFAEFSLSKFYEARAALAAYRAEEIAGDNRPVAWTSQEQLDKAKKFPGHNVLMWGEPLPYHNDIPLYTHPAAQQKIPK